MNGDDRKDREALDRLVDLIVDDILNTSDADILIEIKARHGDPNRHASEMLALFDKSLIAANKKRLAAAKAGAASARPFSEKRREPIDIEEARRRLRRIALEGETVSTQITLAARKESELSDADILGMMDDLHELGLLSTDGDEKT